MIAYLEKVLYHTYPPSGPLEVLSKEAFQTRPNIHIFEIRPFALAAIRILCKGQTLQKNQRKLQNW